MDKRFTTDEIDIRMTIEARKIDISAELLDEEVFPDIDCDHKEKMARMMHQIATQLMGTLSHKAFHQMDGTANVNAPEARPGETVKCENCGNSIQVKKPCCGERMVTVTCAKCGWRGAVRII